MPQIEVAVGEEVTVLVFRNLEPLTPADEAILRRPSPTSAACRSGCSRKGPETAAPLHPREAPPLYYALPEFGVKIFFKPTDFTQVNHAVNRVHGEPRGAIPRSAAGRAHRGPLLRPRQLLAAARVARRRGDRHRGPRAAGGARARATPRRTASVAQFDVANLFSRRHGAAARFDKLLIDPPRDGALEVVKSIGDDGPRRIVYVSCDPATLARDAGLLVHTKGYRLRTAGVVNMFPHTAHVESMAVFERG